MDQVQKKDTDAAESAFIFNPYAAKRKSDAKQEQQEMSRWVVGEECSLEVYISNPCSVQLKIERLCLCIDEADESMRATPLSVAVVLPPKTKPTRVSLTVTPHIAGRLRVIGCHVTLFGITWLQRFVSSLRKVPPLPGGVLVQPEWGTEMNTVVEIDVVPSMPLLKWQLIKADSQQMWPPSLEDSGRSNTQQEKEKILHSIVRAGQRLDFKLKMTNTSQFPVVRAKLMQEIVQRGSEDLPNGAALSVEADEECLMQKLPMFPNDALELPVRLRVGHKAAAAGISNNKDIPAKASLLLMTVS